jgi:DNA replication protein DnaC
VNKKFIPCRRCRGKERIPSGFYRDPQNPSCVIECDHHIEWRRERAHYEAFVSHGFRRDLWDTHYPEDYVGEECKGNMLRVVKFVEVFKNQNEARGATLVFCGPRGCQKTLLASWVGAQLTRAGYDARFVLMNELVHKAMQAERDEKQRLWLESLSECDALIYDEAFDIDKITIYNSGYQIPFIDTFIRGRLRKKTNIFVTNVSIDLIDNRFGPSLKNLISRECKWFDSELDFHDNYLDNKSDIPQRLF